MEIEAASRASRVRTAIAHSRIPKLRLSGLMETELSFPKSER
jgi:hypothetical protein